MAIPLMTCFSQRLLLAWAAVFPTAVATTACVAEETLILGQQAPVPVFRDFVDGARVVVESSAGQPVANVNGLDDDENPTLTADLLEIYFTSRREAGPGSGDIWMARRTARNDPFSAPQPVVAANTEFTETSSAISLDGLSLWFGSDRPGAMGGEGDMDIWTMQRSSRNSPWGDPQLATTLNSIEKDIPRPPGGGGSIMPLSSERDSVGYYQTYLVTLDPDGRATGEPTLLTELVEPQQSIVDAFLTADALGLFYNQVTENQDAQLYFAWRWDQQGEFAESIALNPVNTPSDDRDPWLSPDENLLFFTTNRRGNDEIFATELQLPPRQ